MYRYRNKDVLYSNGSFELTKHEALFSVIIIVNNAYYRNNDSWKDKQSFDE